MGFLRSLAANPYQKPDFKERDEIGRTVHLKVVGRFMVSYWLDHAVKELRIVHIEIV
ncbi:MAG: hypothetical protein HY360_24700 [Verrucomicrobia bacterium]|nr:hypothetical protein [Verrucomicrobiota bacterium]